jgi:hypothetical protein
MKVIVLGAGVAGPAATGRIVADLAAGRAPAVPLGGFILH